MTLYEVLQVRDDASPQVIRAAYKSLMQQVHPDRNVDHTASTERAKAIAEAYRTLSDPELRKEYDERLRREPPATDVASDLVVKAPLSLDDSAKPDTVHWPWVVVATVGLALLVAMNMKQPQVRDSEAFALPTPSRAEIDERHGRMFNAFKTKLVLVWPKDENSTSQMVIVPEIGIELAPHRAAEFKAYFEAHRDEIAANFMADVPKNVGTVRMDPLGFSGVLLARAMHRSFNQHHPEPQENLCPWDGGKAPKCGGILAIHFPESFWVTTPKD